MIKVLAKLKCGEFEIWQKKIHVCPRQGVLGGHDLRWWQWQAFSAYISKKAYMSSFDMVYQAQHVKDKKWTNLAFVFVEQYKFNLEIASNRE